VLELQLMFQCSMHFGLFRKQEFFTNPNYTWSADNGLSVEGKIRWHQWEPTQLRIKVAAAAIAIAPTLKVFVTENHKLRTRRDTMTHLLSVVTSLFNEYKGGTTMMMTELKEVENHQLVLVLVDVDGRITEGDDKLAQGGWKTTNTTGQEGGKQQWQSPCGWGLRRRHWQWCSHRGWGNAVREDNPSGRSRHWPSSQWHSACAIIIIVQATLLDEDATHNPFDWPSVCLLIVVSLPSPFMVEADSRLKLLPASILDIYKVFEHIDMLSTGMQ
jgi:hypothetical protein